MKRASHRGAALLTAMVIVTLVASLAAAMVWRQYRAVQIEAADRARAQAGWVLVGALDWARLILREDDRASRDVDHLGEPWAVPLAEARLSTFLAADKAQGGSNDGDSVDEGIEAFLSGSIEDAQSRYNLSNVIEPKEPSVVEQRVIDRLADAAGISRPALQRWVAQVRSARHASPDADDAPLSPRTLEQLAWVGMDAESRRKLEPWLTFLPTVTPVNFNTAPREVMAATVEGLDLASAERLVQVRRNKPFRNLDDIKQQLPEPLRPAIDDKRISVNSSHYIVTGRLRLDERVMEQRSLVRRRDQEVVLLRRERVSSLAEAETTKRAPLLAP
jgi:general secretion pathway protein K